MRSWLLNSVLVCAMLSQQTGYLFNYFGLANPSFQGLWYKFNGLTHVLLAVCVACVYQNWLDRHNSWTKPLIKYLLISTLNQFVDEIWNCATETQANEWITISLILFHAILKVCGIRYLIIRKPLGKLRNLNPPYWTIPI